MPPASGGRPADVGLGRGRIDDEPTVGPVPGDLVAAAHRARGRLHLGFPGVGESHRLVEPRLEVDDRAAVEHGVTGVDTMPQLVPEHAVPADGVADRITRGLDRFLEEELPGERDRRQHRRVALGLHRRPVEVLGHLGIGSTRKRSSGQGMMW